MSCIFWSRSNRPIFYLTILVSLLLTTTSIASEKPILLDGNSAVVFGGSIDGAAKSNCDTTLIMGPWGSNAPFNGQFEASSSSTLIPAWNGWTSRDNTAPAFDYWNASTYNAEYLHGNGPGNIAAWCGNGGFESCGGGDASGGYGNNLYESLIWEVVVADPTQPAVVTIDAWFNHNVEAYYDYVSFGCIIQGASGQIELLKVDGVGENIHLQETFTYQPGDYVGPLENMVRFEILVTSDEYYSDEDCQYPSNGAVQIDDITMSVDNGSVSYFEDFESGSLGQWEDRSVGGVGDFANIRSGLEDIDVCNTNYSCQVNFVDDGVVVPGTGGSYCIDWCYGPGGFVVNSSGGLAGPTFRLDNSVLSPVMPWPEDCSTGGLLAFDVYVHETMANDSPGIFFSWKVRSTTSADQADIEMAPWLDNGFIFFGEGYRRESWDISSLLTPGATFVQVRLSVVEFQSSAWNFGDNATPAPYFDNVRVAAFGVGGPVLMASEHTLANDGFPANGLLDAQNPGNNSVRFDMATNRATFGMTNVIPGDSLVIEATPRREDAELVSAPVMHYRVKPNTLFDPYRTTGLPLDGTVMGNNVVFNAGGISETKFSFDLPDTGFLFPGDVVHYYFTAADEVAGMDLETSILPADTLGFSDFSDALSYDQSFVFRALPTVQYMDGEHFSTSPILFWDDLGQDSRRPYWHMALKQALGYGGLSYDVYYTNSPSSSLENTLGDRATPAQLDGYSVIFYASGEMHWPSLGKTKAQSEVAPSVDLLDGWLRLGQKNLFLSGDNIVSGLDFAIPAFDTFLSEWMGVAPFVRDIRPYISGQSTPLLRSLAGNPVFYQLDSWRAFGGCPGINTFDAVLVANGGVQLAEFLTPGGGGDLYPYSGATLKEVAEFDSKVISLPYDLSFVWDDHNAAKASASLSARGAIIREALDYFWIWSGPPVAAPDVLAFSASNYPNPFNPKTRIEFNMPQAGQLKIRIFNIRGEQVRTLVDDVRVAGPGSVMWDGTDEEGSNVSAGVYFYEARTGQDVKVGKMALVK